MICDLCQEESDRTTRAASWHVCQWCVSNNVLDHALEVESNITKLREAVGRADARHRRDFSTEAATGSELQLAYTAYADLTIAMRDLEKSTHASKEGLRAMDAARKSVDDGKEQKRRKTLRRAKASHSGLHV